VIHGHCGSCRNGLCNSVRNTRCDILFHSDRFPVLLNEAGGLRCPEPTALRARGSIPDRQLGGARVHRSWGLRPQPQASPSASERRIQRASFETCVAASIADGPLLGSTTACMLRYWVALWTEYKRLHTLLVQVVGRDEMCRRFCGIPGVGPVAARTFKAAIDDPARLPNRRPSAPILG